MDGYSILIIVIILFFVLSAIGKKSQAAENIKNQNQTLDENIIKQGDFVRKNNISISKELTYRAYSGKWYWRFIIDDMHQSVHIIDGNNNTTSIPVPKLIGCEVLQDNEVTGGIKRAIIGGVLAGGAGAVVGASTTKANVTSYVLKIYQDDLSCPQIPMVLLDTETKKDNLDYTNACSFASEVTASIKVLLRRQEESRSNQSNETRNAIAQKTSKIEELKELKKLLEDKTITEEEFEQLKSELLASDGKQ